MKVKPTIRPNMKVGKSKRRGSFFDFDSVPEELGGKLRSYRCAAWTADIDEEDNIVYKVRDGISRRTKCPHIEIDVGLFKVINGEQVLQSFALNPEVRTWWSSPDGKRKRT